MLKLIYRFLLLIILTSNAFAADEIRVSTAFEPVELAFGRRGLLNITISGGKNTSAPTLPEIDGLIIRPLGTQQSMQMFNGNTSASTTYSFSVTAQRAGEFSLPNFEWDINGEIRLVSSPKTKLKVLPEGASPTIDASSSFDLKVTMKADKVYVGQMIPITVTLYAPINIVGQISALPKIEGDNFMSYGLKEGLKDVVEVDGIQRQALRFETYITPLKSGKNRVQYKMGLVVQMPRSVNTNRVGANNFFESMFGNMAINTMEEIEPTSLPETVNVAPLPVHGKPDNFTGAIGEFIIEPLTVTHVEAQVGDPITLKMTVKGTGNMDRISAPVLNAGENWKAYTPKSTFNKEDVFGFSGTKVFEYIIIPQSDKITETPLITFSFFNPETGRYSELTPNPIALKINANPESLAQPNSSLKLTKQKIEQSDSIEPALLPIKLEIQGSRKTGRPLTTNIFFTPSLIGLAVIMGGVLTLIKKRKLKNNADAAYLKQINTERAIQAYLQKVHKAYAMGNAKEFYHAASIVILEVVARHHLKSSQTLHLDDVINFFNEKQLSEESISYIKTIFHTTDMLKFSGVTKEQKLTSESIKNFESLINEIENVIN